MAADPLQFPSSLQLEPSTANRRTIVKCSGKLISDTTESFKKEVREFIPQSDSIVLDLTNVSYMDSSGLGAIVSLYVSARRDKCELRLININQRVAELLRLTKLAGVFEGYGEYL